ncbi:hypothetical protein PLICRDRAFT_33183 [Plicaturopsis crispa FD-325 SS-3]|uniref:Uncharacterized protein n=1 Tax=Plicaturopsis crispa FD-325 SS-3 TaxID=944288 RepID=A0A0C9T450_PLICR|nr:hypothetical protein PLICRDRAFT_33183 [Plicaturopsis crispa FD-325 SS-3]
MPAVKHHPSGFAAQAQWDVSLDLCQRGNRAATQQLPACSRQAMMRAHRGPRTSAYLLGTPALQVPTSKRAPCLRARSTVLRCTCAGRSPGLLACTTEGGTVLGRHERQLVICTSSLEKRLRKGVEMRKKLVLIVGNNEQGGWGGWSVVLLVIPVVPVPGASKAS